MLPMTNKQISNKIWKRVYAARRKHPVFAASTDQAWSVIHAEIAQGNRLRGSLRNPR